MRKSIKKIGTLFLGVLWLFSGVFAAGSFMSGVVNAQVEEAVVEPIPGEDIRIYVFGREGCHYCREEELFLEKEFGDREDVTITYYDVIEDPSAKELFDSVTAANGLPKVTPLTLVGGRVIQGYGSDETTGAAIVDGVERARKGNNPSEDAYRAPSDVLKSGSGCDENDSALICEIGTSDIEEMTLDLPFVGIIRPQEYSLFTLAAVLGTIDGFNPCALWVLLTFLLILMQIGDRKKMLYTAGVFLFAETFMYYLILTVWYRTWDFVGLDNAVTPLVGLLALGSGGYFLRKWYKSRNQLVCDVTSFEQQATIQKKISALIHSPMTIATFFGIVGIALSVNIIEFACSIGVPQVFTKVLEMNDLSTLSYHGYLLVYIIGYMVDDLVIFGFALYGIDKMHASEKYSKLSILIGGLLMIVLGVILLAFPDALVF